VTQHGSFPGRPRGRRARRDGDAPEWQGYEATPEDQREFPDLPPIRPREARARDGGGGGEQGPAGQPGYGGGYPGTGGPGYPQGGQPSAGSGQYGTGQYGGGQAGAGQYGGGQYGGGQAGAGQQGGGQQGGGQYGGGYPGGGSGGPGQAPWGEQPAPGQVPWGEQPAPGQQWPGQQAAQPDLGQVPQYQPPAPQTPEGQPQGLQSPVAQQERPEEDVPSWAVPDSVEAFSERWHRRGLESRDERRTDRRKHRRLLIAGGAVVALAIAATVYLLSGGPGAANLGFGSFVTSFLPGELQQVPDPCTAVPAATLSQYLPGKLNQAAPPLNSGANTECTWTLDQAPTYRVLEVQFQAYSPSGLASGNGSATFAAEDAYQSFENGFTSPGPKSGEPKATVTDLSGLPGGSETSAFQATQVFDRGGATTDVANVFVRYRNVIITVVVDGLDQTTGGKKYGPVAMSDLTTAANAVAHEMAAQIAK
jgi:hypothetical protein